jgi:hypothetical protein
MLISDSEKTFILMLNMKLQDMFNNEDVYEIWNVIVIDFNQQQPPIIPYHIDQASTYYITTSKQYD